MKVDTRMFSSWLTFLMHQARDWRVTVARTSLDRLANQIVFPYLSLYILALGASATELGMVLSLGMVLAGVISPFTGWYIDRVGPRKIYLLGIGLVACSYLTYGLAQDWTLAFVAMALYWLGYSISIHSCATICGNCLTNVDRATGMMICETFGAGLLGMAGPLIGAWLVMMFGGVSATGIRPLFFLAFLFTGITFGIVATQLSNQRWRLASPHAPNVLRDLAQVLREGRHLKRWLLIAAIGQLPLGMVLPFAQVFANKIKGADEVLLGAMVTGAALASIVFAIPLGRLADRIGRKRVLYLSIPLFWCSVLLLIAAPHPVFLLLAGVLQGFYYISGPIAGAMERELVPAEQMGRWIGIARFTKMCFNAGATFLAGIIWDRVGPEYVFLTFVVLEMIFRLPLLISMPETLRLQTPKPLLVPADPAVTD